MSKWILSVLSIGALLINAVSADSPTPRTPSYDAVMQNNFARDFSTDRYLVYPSLISDQFVEGSFIGAGAPATAFNCDAALSFKAGDFNWFGGWAPSSNVPAAIGNVSGAAPATSAALKVGLAKSEAWGGGLLVDFDKTLSSTETATTATTNTYLAPDGIGVFGSFSLRGMGSIFANISSNAFGVGSSDSKPDATDETIITNQLTYINAGWGMFGSGERSPSVGADISIAIGQSTTETKFTGTPATDVKAPDNSAVAISVNGHYGTPLVLKDNDYEVLAGSDASIIFGTTTENAAPKTTGSDFNIILTPNITFQKTLGHGFDAELGGSVNLFDWNMASSKTPGVAPAPDTKVTTNTFKTSNANVNIGLRWVKDNFALEGEVNPLLLINGPYFISGAGAGTFASVGLVLAY